MSVNRLCGLQRVKADWLRVQYEFAALKMMFAGARYRAVLLREERFNPNHDAIGRFTTPSGAVPAGGAGSDTLAGGAGNDQLAQAGGAS